MKNKIQNEEQNNESATNLAPLLTTLMLVLGGYFIYLKWGALEPLAALSINWISSTFLPIAWKFLLTTLLGNLTIFALICIVTYVFLRIFNNEQEQSLNIIGKTYGAINDFGIVYLTYHYMIPLLVNNWNMLALLPIFLAVQFLCEGIVSIITLIKNDLYKDKFFSYQGIKTIISSLLVISLLEVKILSILALTTIPSSSLTLFLTNTTGYYLTTLVFGIMNLQFIVPQDIKLDNFYLIGVLILGYVEYLAYTNIELVVPLFSSLPTIFPIFCLGLFLMALPFNDFNKSKAGEISATICRPLFTYTLLGLTSFYIIPQVLFNFSFKYLFISFLTILLTVTNLEYSCYLDFYSTGTTYILISLAIIGYLEMFALANILPTTALTLFFINGFGFYIGSLALTLLNIYYITPIDTSVIIPTVDIDTIDEKILTLLAASVVVGLTYSNWGIISALHTVNLTYTAIMAIQACVLFTFGIYHYTSNNKNSFPVTPNVPSATSQNFLEESQKKYPTREKNDQTRKSNIFDL
jgi:hypothetical protein